MFFVASSCENPALLFLNDNNVHVLQEATARATTPATSQEAVVSRIREQVTKIPCSF
jgi:hypothetical protein